MEKENFKKNVIDSIYNNDNITVKIYAGFNNKLKKMNFEVESAKDLLISVTSNLLSYNDGEIIPYKEIYSFKKEKEDLFFFDINCNNEIKTTLNNL